MTGWRLGYLAGPREFIELAGEIKYATSICAPASTQMAGIAALDGPQDHLPEMLEVLNARREFMMAALDAIGLSYFRPGGGFTVLVNIVSTGMDSMSVCLSLLRDAHVQVFPGEMYGPSGAGYVRMSFLAPLPTLKEAMSRIHDVITKLRPS
jgi:aminotransferase